MLAPSDTSRQRKKRHQGEETNHRKKIKIFLLFVATTTKKQQKAARKMGDAIAVSSSVAESEFDLVKQELESLFMASVVKSCL